MRFLLYAQHLSGVGHYVRMHELACALAQHHEVRIVEGGRVVPRASIPGIVPIELPRIVRTQAGVAPLAGASTLAAIMTERRNRLLRAVDALSPDVLVIEHYPFSKWELGNEIDALIAAARARRGGVKVICSLRDIPPQTEHEACPAETYASQVLNQLHTFFDAVMIHGEADLTPLEKYFPRTRDIALPLAYTGMICESLGTQPAAAAIKSEIAASTPFVMASVGGGDDTAGLLPACIEAWQRLESEPVLDGRKLVLFCGLNCPAAQLDELRRRAAHNSIALQPFTAGFLSWMRATDLSISHAGYNTCANLLVTGCRALLIPKPRMSDQVPRAELMALLGLAGVIPAELLNPQTLADAMVRELSRPKSRPVVPMDGTQRARDFIERLVS